MAANPSAAWPTSTRVANLSYFLTRNARRFGEEIAVVYDDRTWTWREFDRRVSALCAALATTCGVVKGDRILVHSANNNQMLEIMMATFRLGAVWTPSNFRSAPEEVTYVCQKSGARVMFCEAPFAAHAERCAPMVDHVITIAGAGGEYERLVSSFSGASFPDAEVDRDDPCWLFFTSGSTGKPKASVLTHGQMTFTTLNHLNDLMPGTDHRDASLVVAPLSHGAAMHQITQIAAGAKSVILPQGRLDPAKAWEFVETWKISNLFTVPTIVKILIEDPSVDAFDHSSLRYLVYAGAPMYRTDQKRALAALGPVLVQYYGLGEVTGAITVLTPQDHFAEDSPASRSGTCGFERTGLQVTIQDESGRVLPPRESGEICVIGPAVFAGYYQDDEANAKSFWDGWFRTGDLGFMDEAGYVFITGRSSDMYISGGSNVYPREIEEVLLTHPALHEVAILGVPNPKWGEVGLAVCVPKPGCSIGESEIAEFLAARVAKYKQPQHFVFLDEMPKTNVGKITKKLLRQELADRNLLQPFVPEGQS